MRATQEVLLSRTGNRSSLPTSLLETLPPAYCPVIAGTPRSACKQNVPSHTNHSVTTGTVFIEHVFTRAEC